MVKHGSVCSHPSRPRIGCGPWAGGKFIGQGRARPSSAATGRPITGPWPLTPGHYFLFRYVRGVAANYAANKGVAAKTPPVPSGALAA